MAWILFGVFVAPAVVAVGIRLVFADRPHWSSASHESHRPGAGARPRPWNRWYRSMPQGPGEFGGRWLCIPGFRRSARGPNTTSGTRSSAGGWGVPAPPWSRNPAGRMPCGSPTDRLCSWTCVGRAIDAIIDEVEAAVREYPFAERYETWPGPNSNTFTAFVGRRVPELRLNLPPTAIGKDFLADGAFVGRAPSGTGYQVSRTGSRLGDGRPARGIRSQPVRICGRCQPLPAGGPAPRARYMAVVADQGSRRIARRGGACPRPCRTSSLSPETGRDKPVPYE